MVAQSVWQPSANKQLNDVFFGDNYEPFASVWVRLFEMLNNRRTLKRLRSVNRRPGRLLELGVGSGSLLTDAKAHGYLPLGCDLSEVVCTRVERNTGIPVHCGSLESLAREDLFDVVVMNHVLEHVAEPLAMLEAARRRLRSGGLLHLAVPNVGAWEAHFAGWNSYEPYHLLYFTPDTLHRAAVKAGFEVQQVTTHESFSGWFLAMVRTLWWKKLATVRESRGSQKNATSAKEHVYRVAMIGVGMLTIPFRRVQERFGKGDEVILVGRHAEHD